MTGFGDRTFKEAITLKAGHWAGLSQPDWHPYKRNVDTQGGGEDTDARKTM